MQADVFPMAIDARYTIDSLSEGLARLEAPDGSLLTVPADWLPADAREGDVLAVSAGGGKPGQSGGNPDADDRLGAGQDPADREGPDADEEPAAARTNPARPGDDSTVTFRRDPEATAARRQSVRGKLDRLRRRGQA